MSNITTELDPSKPPQNHKGFFNLRKKSGQKKRHGTFWLSIWSKSKPHYKISTLSQFS